MKLDLLHMINLEREDPVPRPGRIVVGLIADPDSYLRTASETALDAITTAAHPDDAAHIEHTVRTNPLAATTLDALLRITPSNDIPTGVTAESALYSQLLSGPEFARWRSVTARRPSPAAPEPVLVARDDNVLTITMNRPDRHNAFGRDMRDALVEALTIAELDATIEAVHLVGNGKSFCSGGDLDEFGTADPLEAHLLRTTQNVGLLVHRLRDRMHVHLDGACIGAGIEVPAFAAHVTASESTFCRLPELAMGLIPGAGGTASITGRIGRHRTAWMALTGLDVHAEAALRWGLVDQIT